MDKNIRRLGFFQLSCNVKIMTRSPFCVAVSGIILPLGKQLGSLDVGGCRILSGFTLLIIWFNNFSVR